MRRSAMLALLAVLCTCCAFAQIPTDSLIAYFPLDGNVYDATGNGHNGVVYGGVSLGTNRTGSADSALVFDGTGYVTISNQTSLQVGSRFSIAFWFKLTGAPGGGSDWAGLVTKASASKQADAGPRAMVWYSYAKSQFYFQSMAPDEYIASATPVPLSKDTWYHYAITADGDSVRMYLDGAFVFGWPQDYSWTFSNYSNLTLGSQVGTYEGRTLVGSLDDVLFYSRPLSAVEIQYLYDGKEPLTISVPDTVAQGGDTVFIPVRISDLADANVLAYQFVVKFNSSDSILAATGSVITQGTLTGAAEWDVVVNSTVANQVSVGASGLTALSGSGDLLKLGFVVLPSASTGKSTSLTFSNVVFNAGSPAVLSKKGTVTIGAGTCGDVDQNGSVQAYDAALALRYAVGYDDSLSAQGLVNADVDQNGSVQAYDAALILRHVVGLSMPDGVSPCFLSTSSSMKKFAAGTPSINATLSSLQDANGVVATNLRFAATESEAGLVSLSFDVVLPSNAGSSVSATLSSLPANYIGALKKISSQRYRVAIVSPYGIDAKAVDLSLTASSQEALSSVVLENVLLNATASSTLTLYAGQGASSPASFALVGAYPNPFNPSTQVVFELPKSSQVILEVFDALGRSVCQIMNQSLDEGRHTATWDGRANSGLSVSSGRYFIRMQAGTFSKTIMVLLLK